MRAVWATALCVLVGCRMVGTETHFGVSDHDMSFGEVNFVLADAEEDSAFRSVPFLVAGQGTLPAQYGNDVPFQRVSLGERVRLPFRLAEGRIVVYVEAGGMVSYYESEAIGTPFEPEVVAGVGLQLDLGNKWAVNLGARARRPMGNGNDHDEPEHAPDGTQPEFFFGVRKDF